MPRTRAALSLRAALLVFCAGITLIVVGAYNEPSGPSPASGIVREPLAAAVPTPPPGSLNPNQKPVRIETEIITILPKGFEPAEITRPVGRFNLMIDNRSGLEDVSLQLDREGGARLLSAQVDRSKLDWNDVFDLAPGRYLLTEATHPEWVCFLTITQ